MYLLCVLQKNHIKLGFWNKNNDTNTTGEILCGLMSLPMFPIICSLRDISPIWAIRHLAWQ